MKLARESWWLGLICTADMLLTAWLLARGQAQEANPIMRYYVDMGLMAFLAAKSLLFIAPIFVLELIRRQRPKTVQTVLRAGIALYLISYGVGTLQVNARGDSADTHSESSVLAPQR